VCPNNARAGAASQNAPCQIELMRATFTRSSRPTDLEFTLICLEMEKGQCSLGTKELRPLMKKIQRTPRKDIPQTHEELVDTLLNQINEQTPVDQEVKTSKHRTMQNDTPQFEITHSDVQQMTACRKGDNHLFGKWLFDGVEAVMSSGAAYVDGSKMWLLHVLKTALLNSEPQNPIETMLYMQMMTAHEMSIRFASVALANIESPEINGAFSNRAERMMSLFARQAECMQKLKGLSGQQKVVVEHLNVTEGGKAVVGQVISKRDEGHEGKS
jgi:hypothetical protein